MATLIEKRNIYIDLIATNTIQTNPNDRVATAFNLSQPILHDTTDYKMSVIRFSINTETLPVFIPTMSTNEDDSTIYSCTMEFNGFLYQQYMIFEPQNTNPIAPEEKYYVNSYQYVVYLFNKMLQQCIINLGDIVTLPVDTVAPVLFFDVDSQLCGISINPVNYGFNETDKINIYFNTQLYALFSTMPASTTYLINGMDFQLNNLITTDKSLMVQEYKTIELWNPVSSLVFTTDRMPIYESITSPLQVYIDGKLSNNNSGYHFKNILTDFIGNEMIFTPYVQYAPSVFRYMNLRPNSQINSIDLQVQWINKMTGEMRPLYLVPGGSCSLKLYITKDA